MKNYLVLYHAPAAALEKMQDATPEQMKAGMEPWMAWAQRCGSHLVDLGTPLGGGQKVTTAGSPPSDRGVAGYSMLQAEDASRGAGAAGGSFPPGVGGRLRDRDSRVPAAAEIEEACMGPRRHRRASADVAAPEVSCDESRPGC